MDERSAAFTGAVLGSFLGPLGAIMGAVTGAVLVGLKDGPPIVSPDAVKPIVEVAKAVTSETAKPIVEVAKAVTSETAKPIVEVATAPVVKGAAFLTIATVVTAGITKYLRRNLQKVQPKYDTIKSLGRGGFGEVFLCKDRKSGHLVAVKTSKFYKEGEKKPQEIEQLENEIELLSKLKHERIIQYYSSGVFEDQMCIMMEYMPAGSVRGEMDREKAALCPDLAVWYIKQTTEGIQYLHGERILHRDVKCANLLCDSSGNIKLCDFGIAKELENTMGKTARSNEPGTFVFLAPEIFKKGEKITAASDIWSIACTMVEMLTSVPPWHGMSVQVMITQLIGGNKPTYKLTRNISNGIHQFLDRCLNPDPKGRPTPAQLLEMEVLRVGEYPGPISMYNKDAYITGSGESSQFISQ